MALKSHNVEKISTINFTFKNFKPLINRLLNIADPATALPGVGGEGRKNGASSHRAAEPIDKHQCGYLHEPDKSAPL